MSFYLVSTDQTVYRFDRQTAAKFDDEVPATEKKYYTRFTDEEIAECVTTMNADLSIEAKVKSCKNKLPDDEEMYKMEQLYKFSQTRKRLGCYGVSLRTFAVCSYVINDLPDDCFNVECERLYWTFGLTNDAEQFSYYMLNRFRIGSPYIDAAYWRMIYTDTTFDRITMNGDKRFTSDKEVILFIFDMVIDFLKNESFPISAKLCCYIEYQVWSFGDVDFDDEEDLKNQYILDFYSCKDGKFRMSYDEAIKMMESADFYEENDDENPQWHQVDLKSILELPNPFQYHHDDFDEEDDFEVEGIDVPVHLEFSDDEDSDESQ